MERKRLNATKLKSAGYDRDKRILEIEFRDGSIMQYNNVSEEIHRRLMNSPSPGSYFEDEIEDRFRPTRAK